MAIINEMRLDFPAFAQNESFARLAVSAFLLPLDPTIDQLADVKTSVSEAVTNAIVHGYGMRGGTVRLHAVIRDDGTFSVDVIDRGCGIADIEMARRPFFTTRDAEERSGMGFTVMESFMDSVKVKSAVGVGTTVTLTKHFDLRGEEMPAAQNA